MDQAPEQKQRVKLISVVTVVYNRASEMEATIQSVAQQTFKDLEYIVIDGGSNDGTVEVIKKHEESISHWISEPDKGIYDAMNKGLTIAKGEWVYFLNCGDAFYNHHILETIAMQLLKTKFSVLAGKVFTTGTGGGLLLPRAERLKNNSARMLFSSSFCHQAIFVRREAYLEAGGFNRAFRTFADFDVIHRVIQHTKGFEHVDIIIARYDLSGISNNWRYTLRHFRESEKLFESHGEGSNALVYTLRYLKAYLFYIRKWSSNLLTRA